MGSKIRPPSYASTRPAPRDVQTENVSAFRAASLLLVACTSHRQPLLPQPLRPLDHWTDAYLTVPAIGKEEEMAAVEENVEDL